MRIRRALLQAAAALFVVSGSVVTATALHRWPAGSPAGAATKLPTCNLSALAAHKGVVNITFWNSMVQANATTLAAITNAFNASQSKVHVTLVAQASYDDTWEKYEAGLSNGQLPDAVQLEDIRTQAAIDTQSFLPGAVLHERGPLLHLGLPGPPPRLLEGERGPRSAPLRRVGPILFYNQNAFTKAGLNPPTRPATLPQMLADAKALKASGSGMGLVLDPWHLETWLARPTSSS
jgi:sn-glycerol 3-phosphate transport system substrate-binding protein